MSSASLTADRVLVATAVVATCVLFVPDAADPVNVVKLVALLLCVLALGVVTVARVARERVLHLPVGPLVWAALAFLLALLVATVVAPDTFTAVWGTAGRNSGLLAYGSAVVLLLVCLRVMDVRGSKHVLVALLLAGAFTTTYGLLQYVGVDAIGWNNPFSPIIAGLGNPNFAAAYMGIAIPAMVWGALHDWPLGLRLVCGALALVSFGVAALSESVQGPLAGGAGLVVLLLAWVLNRSAAVRRTGLAVTGVLALLGVGALGAGLLGIGPANAFFAGISYRARTWYWEGALNMFGSQPVVGVGLDSYGLSWYRERPLESVRELGGDHYSDAAHSVPLQMLGTGGLVLGLTYLAVVLVTAYALAVGLRRLRGADRLVLGALGGSWVAYQVQSIISIDQVPLLVVHFVLAGTIVAVAGQVRLREVRLPGALPVAAPVAEGRRRAVPKERESSPADLVLVGVAALVALFLGYQALDPLRASRNVYAGDLAQGAGDGQTALASFERAVELEPGNAAWHARLGNLYNAANQPELALATYQRAVEVNPYDVAALRTVGRLADTQGELEESERRFRRALELDPDNSATIRDLADFLVRNGRAEEARRLLEDALEEQPDNAALLAGLGGARAALDDVAGARESYQRALAIQPGEPTATAGLQALDAA